VKTRRRGRQYRDRAVARSQPDGYTLLASVGSLSVAPHIVAKLPADPMRDLRPSRWR
jgi:tripartite-type tricarboxylate transporter receptor subunit TctC